MPRGLLTHRWRGMRRCLAHEAHQSAAQLSYSSARPCRSHRHRRLRRGSQRHLRKSGLVTECSLCLSRACLGKTRSFFLNANGSKRGVSSLTDHRHLCAHAEGQDPSLVLEEYARRACELPRQGDVRGGGNVRPGRRRARRVESADLCKRVPATTRTHAAHAHETVSAQPTPVHSHDA